MGRTIHSHGFFVSHRESLATGERTYEVEIDTNHPKEVIELAISALDPTRAEKFEKFKAALKDISEMPEIDQDDAHRLRHKAKIALEQ